MLKRALVYLLMLTLPWQSYAVVNHCPPEQHHAISQQQVYVQHITHDHQHMGDHQHTQLSQHHDSVQNRDSGCHSSLSYVATDHPAMVLPVIHDTYVPARVQKTLTIFPETLLRPPRLTA